MEIINPHDKLFREAGGDKAFASDILKNYLPRDVLKLIDLNTLEISKDSFIEKELKDYYSDLLYKINLADKPGYVYILFEHKSYKDRLAPLQVLEYMTKIWRLHLKQHKKEPLPVIIPMFLYHGQSRWKDTKFSDLMNDSASLLSDYVPDFKYIMLDLTQYPDEEIKGAVLSRVVMLLFKHIFDPDIIEKLPGIFSLMQEIIEAENGMQYLEVILRYIFSTIDVSDEEIKNVVEKSVSREKGEFIMTAMERWQNEAIKNAEKTIQIEAIQMGLMIKFKDKCQKFMAIINKIEDIEKLKQIKQAVIKVNDEYEFLKLIEQ
ncbi:Putative recombination-promoting nuclease, RpnA-like [Desulfonema limicola]|uniref:Recombination-promoting nuclease, RpnA-like n=1 Tax=Desulfonema limicola TaxID=45656 RepID=A0A975GHG0_9BACT|nr:Rpn family recombination-promoting nuclease/putative transposase [Desulfonema limicola]QTA81269.1 Putative recombination-promoting nuclease, RpnA-like [Desulfonema limicola]